MPSPQRTESLSPPPLKRRRLSPPPTLAYTSSFVPLPYLSTLRIFTWNVNGIAPFLSAVLPHNQKQITKFFSPTKRNGASPTRATKPKSGVRTNQPSLRACLHRWQWPQVVCLQEVKIGRDDEATQRAVQAAANPRQQQSVNNASDDEGSNMSAREAFDGPAYDAHFALPRDRFNARGPSGSGKVYGVCTLLRRDLENVTVKEMEWDVEGRVLVLEIPSPQPVGSSLKATSITHTLSHEPAPAIAVRATKGKGRGLAVFNVYAVNGTTLPYRDPATGTIIGDRHGHKRRFHTRLASAVLAYQAEGWDVVIAGDLNISRSHLDSFPAQRMGKEHMDNRADFERKFISAQGGGLGMIDAFREIHGEERIYTYRPPGKPWGSGMDRVDLILCSGAMRGRYDGGKDGAGTDHGRRQQDMKEQGKGWRLVEADILDTEEERGPSDHVPLYVGVERAVGDLEVSGSGS